MFSLYKRTLKNPVKIIIHISHPYCKSIHRIASKDAPGGQTSGAKKGAAKQRLFCSFLDEFNYRYGFNFNLGYDILNNFSIYTLFGSGFVKYTHGTKEKLKADLISGFGFSYDISQYWRINLEYTNQNLPIRKIENNIYKTRLQNLTVGISYKF